MARPWRQGGTSGSRPRTRPQRPWRTPGGCRSASSGSAPFRSPRGTSPADQRLRDYQRFRESIAGEWTRRQAAAIRAADPEALVTVGLIQWSVPLNLAGPWHYAAFRPRQIAPWLDFLEVHFYPLDGGVYHYENAEAERREPGLSACRGPRGGRSRKAACAGRVRLVRRRQAHAGRRELAGGHGGRPGALVPACRRVDPRPGSRMAQLGALRPPGSRGHHPALRPADRRWPDQGVGSSVHSPVLGASRPTAEGPDTHGGIPGLGCMHGQRPAREAARVRVLESFQRPATNP